MKVFDCFPFFNELDLLEIRLNLLNDIVDYFVIVEAKETFTGIPKPLYFENNKQRYNQFLHKIIHIIIEPFNKDFHVSIRETKQKNYIFNGLKQCNDDDIILISDLDEIPNPSILKNVFEKNLTNKFKLICLKNKNHLYYINNYVSELIDGNISYKDWDGTRILNYGFAKHCTVQNIRSPQLINTKQIYIENAGWHFSYLGGKEKIIEKIEAYAHYDYVTPEVKNNLEKNISSGVQDIFSRKIKSEIIPIKNNFPDYIVNNQEKYSHLILK